MWHQYDNKFVYFRNRWDLNLRSFEFGRKDELPCRPDDSGSPKLMERRQISQSHTCSDADMEHNIIEKKEKKWTSEKRSSSVHKRRGKTKRSNSVEEWWEDILKLKEKAEKEGFESAVDIRNNHENA